MLRGLSKIAASPPGTLPNMATGPKVPSTPKVRTPGPAVKGAPATVGMKMLAPPGGPTGGLSVSPPTQVTGPATDATGGIKAAFLDAGLSPLLAGAGGGLGGYLLGTKVIDPLIQARQDTLRRKLAMGEKVLATMERTRKIAPLVAGALGALMLASLATGRVGSGEKDKMERAQRWSDHMALQPASSSPGFAPHEQLPVGQPAFY